MPRTTLTEWRAAAVKAGRVQADVVTSKRTDWTRVREDAAQAFLTVAQKRAQLMDQELDVYLTRNSDEPLKPAGLREIGILTGIAIDKYFDMTDGRKGVDLRIDNRSYTA